MVRTCEKALHKRGIVAKRSDASIGIQPQP